MQLPKLDLSALPDLPDLTGLFGSLGPLARTMPGHDDSIIILATFLYEISPPTGLI